MATVHNTVFDALFEAGAASILAGQHQRDRVPVNGGRWPVSVIAQPPAAVAERFHRATEELIRYAGPGHFRTGRADAVHCTVRALEPYLVEAGPNDPITTVWSAAIERAARRVSPVELVWTGLTVTGSGVLAQLETPDGSGWDLMDTVRAELADHGWYEERWMPRNIWYASLLHFTGAIDDPAALVDWVRQRRRMEQVRFAIEHLALVRFVHDRRGTEQAMVPQVWRRWAL